MKTKRILSVEWFGFLGFSIALAALLLIGAMTLRFLQETRMDDRLVEHAHEVIETLETCLLADKTMEANARAFVLTGADTNLELYKSASSSLVQSLESVKRLTIDNPPQHGRILSLRPLIDRRLTTAEKIIAARRQLGQQPAIAILFQHDILSVVKDIHKTIKEMQTEERGLLTFRMDAHAKNSSKLKRIILLGSSLAIFFVLSSLFMIHSDLRSRQRTEEALRLNQKQLQRQTEELQLANKELETFSYSVSHDLRAPLRGIEGFSQLIREDYWDRLDAQGQGYFERVCMATKRMGLLIDEILSLSRITRSPMKAQDVDLAGQARTIADDLEKSEPGRKVQWRIPVSLHANGDLLLLNVALTNLLSNSWKFTSKRSLAIIELGALAKNGKQVYYVRDNGVGFDMAYQNKLFQAFQRLHSTEDYPGTGIGLATVQRIIRRHGGEIWADSVVDQGAVFYFTLC